LEGWPTANDATLAVDALKPFPRANLKNGITLIIETPFPLVE
jgi:hypothetical protein